MGSRQKILVKVCGMPTVLLDGPAERMRFWLSDPQLPLSIPGIRIEPSDGFEAPVIARIRAAKVSRVTSENNGTRWLLEGDLSSFGFRDFRLILTYLSRWVLLGHGRHFIHSGCVVAPSGEAALLCGPSGSGKTTLSLLLSQRWADPIS